MFLLGNIFCSEDCDWNGHLFCSKIFTKLQTIHKQKNLNLHSTCILCFFFSPHRVDELLSAVCSDTVQMCEVGAQEGNTVQCVLAQWAADSRLNCMLVHHMTP